MNKIYLDNSATTRVDEAVVTAMKPYFNDIYGNASSIHSFGQEARVVVDQARETVASFLNCDPTEIIFTSGGSEADNLAIKGIVTAVISNDSEKSHGISRLDQSMARNDKIIKPHVITTAFEHHAVLNTIRDLEREGKIEATYIKPNHEGIIDPKDIEAAIKENTILVSVMYVNNEVGTIQPIKQIGDLLKTQNEKRKRQNLGVIFLHTDAVQAAEFCPMDVKELGVDLLTITAHKIHGPKGIGALYIKKGVPIKSQITGGDQEFRLRAGTENVAGIAGLAAAITEIKTDQSRLGNRAQTEKSPVSPPASQGGKIKNVEGLRNKLEEDILKNISNTKLNGVRDKRVPHISNISFINAEGESIILNLDMLGIAVSSGSACTSSSLEPSHVLTSMGVPATLAHGSIRFSLSRETTEAEIDKVLEVLPGIIEKLRAMSPLKN